MKVTFPIKRKLKLLLILPILFFVLISTLFTYQFAANYVKNDVKRQQEKLLTQTASEIEDILKFAHSIITDDAITLYEKLLQNPENLREEFGNFYYPKVFTRKHFTDGIYLFDTTCTVIASTNTPSTGQPILPAMRDVVTKTFKTAKPQQSNVYSSMKNGTPALLMTAPVPDESGEITAVICIGIDLLKDRILGRLSGYSIGENGTVFLADTAGVFFSTNGTGSAKALHEQIIHRFPNFVEESATTAVISYSAKEYLSSFNTIPSFKWMLAICYPTNEAFISLHSFQKRFIMGNVIFLAIVLLLLSIVTGKITKPIEQITREIKELTGNAREENRELRLLKIITNDEVRVLADNFNELYTVLREQYCALNSKNSELESVLLNLKQTQEGLLQSEKMASIGQLAAGVAHEINNPIGFVISNGGTLKEYIEDIKEVLSAYEKGEPVDALKEELGFDEMIEDIDQLLADNNEGLKRVADIVRNLKSFAHNDPDGKFVSVDVNTLLHETLLVARNELKFVAEVKEEYGTVPPVMVRRGEINQVFLNIIVNAAQALRTSGKNSSSGVVTITTATENRSVVIRINDNGPGIPGDVIENIFNPFFTTKDVGEGTGLGLSISYDIIVRKHGGKLEVSSDTENGTTFRITLPCENEA